MFLIQLIKTISTSLPQLKKKTPEDRPKERESKKEEKIRKTEKTRKKKEQ